MNRIKNITKALLVRSAVVVALLAVGAGTGCDLTDSIGILGDLGYVDGGFGGTGGGDWFDYGWTESDPNGNTNSFNLNPGTDVHTAVDNYLSDSVIW